MSERKIDRSSQSRFTSDSSSYLGRAKELRAEISKIVRLTESDREQFAINLGRLYIEAQRHQPDLSFSRIFTGALGISTGESLVKKRLTVLILEGESTNSQGLRANPDFYIRIAIELVKYLPQVESDDEAIALLRLTENSSFSFDGAIRDKFTAQCVSDLKRVYSHIIDSLQRQVDLDWLYEWTEDHPIWTSGDTGELNSIDSSLGGLDNFLNFNVDGDRWTDRQQRNCCPCIQIAKLRLPISDPHSVVSIPVAIDGMDDLIDLQSVLADRIVSFCESKGVERSSSLDLNDVVEQAPFMISQLERALFEDEILRLGVEMRVDLEVRYNKQLNRWEVVLLYRMDLIDCTIPKEESIVGYHGCSIGFDEYSCETLFAVTHNIDQRISVFFLDLGEYDYGHGLDFEPPGASSIGTAFNLTTEMEDDLALRSDLNFESLIWTPEDDDWNSRFTPAPRSSLAHLILQNFAYAPVAERIDTLIIRDALRKEKLIRDYANKSETNFRTEFEARLISRNSR